MPAHKKFTEEEARAMLEEWKRGTSIRGLAVSRDSNWTTVWKYLSSAGLMDAKRVRVCKDCPALLVASPNGKWKIRCDPCHIQFEYRQRVRYNRKRVTGVAHEQYEAMLAEQKGLCAICRNGPTPNRTLGVDHDHDTLRVRGLLCNLCNVGLGAFNDDMRVMKLAIAYLEKHRQLSLLLPAGERDHASNTRCRSTVGNRDPQKSAYGKTRRHLRAENAVGRRYRGKRHQVDPRAPVS